MRKTIITSNSLAQTERKPDLKPNQQSDQRVKTDKDFEKLLTQYLGDYGRKVVEIETK